MKRVTQVHTDQFWTRSKSACSYVLDAVSLARRFIRVLDVFDTLPAAMEGPDFEVITALEDILDGKLS